MSTIILNIETAADEESPSLASMSQEQFDAPKGWKDPEKIAEYKAQKYADAISTASLHPLTGKIICVGWWILSHDSTFTAPELVVVAHDDELTLLMELKNAVYASRATQVVTYNGKAFDLPYLRTAYMRKQLQVPTILVDPSWDTHIDMFEKVGKQGPLKEWSRRILGQTLFGDGSLVQSWYDTEDWDAIRRHCKDNVLATGKLYGRLYNIQL